MAQMSKEQIEQMLKDYRPEVLEYDPDIDGSEEHKIRDELLSEKERLRETITARKGQKRGEKKARQ